MTNLNLRSYQVEFIDFLLKTQALKFGNFTLKSGRQAPYFVNFGDFNTTNKLDRLGYFYAQQLVNHQLTDIDTIFGPTYKGVPLAISAAHNLSKLKGQDYGFTFNRKEVKTHGESGLLVGTNINEQSKLVIVEDVITAGTTMREIIPLIRNFGAEIKAVIIAVDRCEKGTSNCSALAEISEEFEVKILPIVSIKQIQQYLTEQGKLSEQQHEQIASYLNTYGA